MTGVWHKKDEIRYRRGHKSFCISNVTLGKQSMKESVIKFDMGLEMWWEILSLVILLDQTETFNDLQGNNWLFWWLSLRFDLLLALTRLWMFVSLICVLLYSFFVEIVENETLGSYGYGSFVRVIYINLLNTKSRNLSMYIEYNRKYHGKTPESSFPTISLETHGKWNQMIVKLKPQHLLLELIFGRQKFPHGPPHACLTSHFPWITSL